MTVHTTFTDTGFYPYSRFTEGVSGYREDNGQIDLISFHHIRKKDDRLVFDSAKYFSKTRFIINQNRRFEYEWDTQGKLESDVRSSQIAADLKGVYLSLSTDESFGAFMNGRCWCNYDKNIGELLRGPAASVVGTENIDNVGCYIVSAMTPYGVIRAWIAPERDYNCLQFTIQKTPKDIYADAALGNLRIDGKKVLSSLNVMDHVQLEFISGRWIVISGQYRTVMSLDDGTKATRLTVSQRSDVNPKPDFIAMGAFVPKDLPNGTRVYEGGISGSSPLIFEWRDGQVVPRIDQVAVSQIQQTAGQFDLTKITTGKPDGSNLNVKSYIGILVGVILVGAMWWCQRYTTRTKI
jgi:hypothetical protein